MMLSDIIDIWGKQCIICLQTMTVNKNYQTDSVTRTVGVARSLSAMTSGSPGAHEKRSPDSQQWPTTTNFPVASLAVSLSTTMGC